MFLETLDVATVSEANLRENRHVVAARKRNHRTIARVRIEQKAGAYPLALPLVVKMTRLSPRELDDDNLSATPACGGSTRRSGARRRLFAWR